MNREVGCCMCMVNKERLVKCTLPVLAELVEEVEEEMVVEAVEEVVMEMVVDDEDQDDVLAGGA